MTRQFLMNISSNICFLKDKISSYGGVDAKYCQNRICSKKSLRFYLRRSNFTNKQTCNDALAVLLLRTQTFSRTRGHWSKPILLWSVNQFNDSVAQKSLHNFERNQKFSCSCVLVQFKLSHCSDPDTTNSKCLGLLSHTAETETETEDIRHSVSVSAVCDNTCLFMSFLILF